MQADAVRGSWIPSNGAEDRLIIMTTALSDTPRPPATGTRTEPLPDGLKLTPLPHQGRLDGAWCPRTRHPAAELNALVAGLASRGVVATRLSLGITTWDSTPGRLRLDDREVRLIWFTYRTPHTVIVRHGVDELTLLVISPGATETSGARAIALASDPDNVTGASDILTASEATSHAKEA
jgi:hypothetical protein